MKKALYLTKKYLWDEAWAWIGIFLVFKISYLWLHLLVKAPEGPSSLIRFTIISLIILTAPGLFIIRAAKYKSKSIINSILLVSGLSISISTGSVFILYQIGIYYKTSLILLLVLFSILGLWGITAIHPFSALKNIRQSWQSADWLERLTYIFFAIMFLDLGQRLVGQPFTDWDAIVSWDKWGCDMAERHALGSYCMGGYGQMLPSLYSIYYKIAGSFLNGVPDEQLLLRGLNIIFPVFLFLAMIRICRVIKISWPLATILFFGHYETCCWISSGHADIPATAMNLLSLAVLLDLLNKNWEFPDRPYLAWGSLGLFLFASGFMKAHGIIWIIFLMAYAVLYLYKDESLKKNARPLATCCTIALVLLAPFYLHQIYFSINFNSLADHNSRLLSYDIMFSRPDLFSTSAWDALEKLRVFISRNQSLLPSGVMNFHILTPVLAVLILSSLRNKQTWPLCIVSVVFILMWFYTRSYDYRNVLPAFALVSIIAAGGLSQMKDSWPYFKPKMISFASMVLMLLFSGALIMFYIANITGILKPYSSSNCCWPVKPENRLYSFDKNSAYIRDIINKSSIGRKAEHIHSFNSFFRYLGKRGLYLYQPNSASNISQGDLVVFQNNNQLLPRITPICRLQSLSFDFIGMKEPAWQQAHYSINGSSASAIKQDFTLQGSSYADIRIEELQNLTNLNSAAIQLQCDADNTPISVHLHPDLRSYSSFFENMRSIQTENTANYFFWLDNKDHLPLPEVLLRIENTNSSPVTITNVMIVL